MAPDGVAAEAPAATESAARPGSLVARRITKLVLRLVVVLLLVSFGIFLLVRLLPGDPVERIIPYGLDVEAERAELREELGLDQPMLGQYVDWLSRLLRGDLGTDYVTRTPVSTSLASSLPVTLQLLLYAQILALLVAVPLGVLTAYKARSRLDRVTSTTAFGMLAVPDFVLGLYLAYFVGAQLGWLPAGGYTRPGDDLGEHLRSMALPTISLAAGQVAVYLRLLRSDMISTLQESFVTVARSKGLTDRYVLWRHALRPSSLTLLTVAGLNVGTLVGGAVVIENLFSLPGIGTQVYRAIIGQQYVVLQSYVAVIAVSYVLINFVVDLLYTVLDPRIRDARA
jgi:peptide/nickel transport system permease protein